MDGSTMAAGSLNARVVSDQQTGLVTRYERSLPGAHSMCQLCGCNLTRQHSSDWRPAHDAQKVVLEPGQGGCLSLKHSSPLSLSLSLSFSMCVSNNNNEGKYLYLKMWHGCPNNFRCEQVREDEASKRYRAYQSHPVCMWDPISSCNR